MADTPDIVTRFVPCPYCRGKTTCDCDVCFGRGRIPHPGDVAKTLTTLRTRLAEVNNVALAVLHSHRNNMRDDMNPHPDDHAELARWHSLRALQAIITASTDASGALERHGKGDTNAK